MVHGRKGWVLLDVTLKNLAIRLAMDMKLKEKHPESKEMLERQENKTKELIVQCVLDNIDNKALEQIILK